MKKLIKGALITAVVLIVIGTGLFIGGSVALGGVQAAGAALKGYEFYINDDGVHLTIEENHVRNSHHWEYH